VKNVYLIGPVEPNLARNVISEIDSAVEPTLLHITSEGGNADDAIAIIAAIRRCRFPVHTYGVSSIFSCALDVLAHGTTRGVHPWTTAMTHATTGLKNPHYKDLNREIEQSLYENFPLVIQNWNLLFSRRQRYWNPQDLLSFGFIDYVATRPTIK
jgi:ATP-dependent protease ClpP protease subunit